tara:strand:+ start:712 stop:1218 length:507 start_codon:yes stop_codon:yes gene_type:complete
MPVLINHLLEMGYLAVDPESDPPDDYSSVIQKALACQLPAHYREFIDHFPRTGSCYLETFIGLDIDDDRYPESEICWSTLFGYENSALGGIIPINQNSSDYRIENMLLIGDDAFGNWLYMSVEPDRDSSIYFMDRRFSQPGDRYALLPLASTFEQFILNSYTKAEEFF